MPLRFSLYEFGEITRLNCDPFDKNDLWDVDHKDFWLEMKVPTSEGPTFKELQAIFPLCRNWSREKRVMVGLLGLLCIGIFGNRIEGVDVPLLSWRGSRPRINFTDFVAQEKREHPKVCVRHMVVKPIEDRYPKWEDNTVFTDLDNMIQDILNDQLDEKFWEVMADSKSKEEKKPHTNDVSPSTKRKKVQEHVDRSETVEAHNMAITGLVESVKNLAGKLDGIDDCVADKVIAKLDAVIQAKVDARIGLYESESKKKIAMLEEELKNLKQQHGIHIPTEVAKSNGGNSIAQEEDDASCNALIKD
ncbi:unnamed protein product [Eruca vesicaria subsp. sativa]|uniref:Uncharacterized protein n=1 Tax=Eruca vesicaria subsp. sativa TaxID=29727 RepID=A0ABC8LDX0_ERUVS|nr:unnamed protein product [Eruca vesicaria subsp. sativa]